MNKKILFLAGEFKGSLPALTVADIVQKELPRAEIKLISDGGNGLLSVFASAYPKGEIRAVKVLNAYNKQILTHYFLFNNGKSAVIESARVCALSKESKAVLRPKLMSTSSRGMGAAVKAAAKPGVKEIFIGLGGVGCNDGGAGMARELGVKFYGKNGAPLQVNTGNLAEIESADLSALKKYKKIRFYGVADVKNKLLGPLGSAAVYGPQKGAGKKEIAALETGLKNLARVIKKETGRDFSKIEGSGAAGAIGFGVLAFLNAQMTDGAAFIFEKTDVEKAVKKADLVITTEGKLDRQTFMGKAPGRAAALAKKYKKELIFICGINEISPKAAKAKGITLVLPFAKTAKEITFAKSHAAEKLKETLKNIGLIGKIVHNTVVEMI